MFKRFLTVITIGVLIGLISCNKKSPLPEKPVVITVHDTVTNYIFKNDTALLRLLWQRAYVAGANTVIEMHNNNIYSNNYLQKKIIKDSIWFSETLKRYHN